MRAALYAALAVACIGLVALWSSCGTVPQDSVGFQVGGGFADSQKYKVKSDLLEPGRHVLGTWDTVWTFPAYRTIRFQDFQVPVTTLDGKAATIVGQMNFRFVGEKDPAMAREFAEGIGSRKYRNCDPQGNCEDAERVGEGNNGLTGFLNQLVTPEINSTLKAGFGREFCADFEPSCRVIDPRDNVPPADPEKVYTEMSQTLQDAVDKKLMGKGFDYEGEDGYLRDISIRVSDVILPEDVQSNINEVTAEQARTKKAEQSQATATAEAAAINIKGKAIRDNQDVLPLEIAKVCGQRCTIIVDASGNGVSTSVPATR